MIAHDAQFIRNQDAEWETQSIKIDYKTDNYYTWKKVASTILLCKREILGENWKFGMVASRRSDRAVVRLAEIWSALR